MDTPSLADLCLPVTVQVVPPKPTVSVPAVFGHPELGTDRLIHVPRIRLSDMVVYVAMESSEARIQPAMAFVPHVPRALYVGLTSDFDARRARHEAEVLKGNDASPGGSNIPRGSFEILRADWLVVPVPAEHGRRLERVLTIILQPMLQVIKPGRLDVRHRRALVAAGWTEEVAAHLVKMVDDRERSRQAARRPWPPSHTPSPPG